MSGPTITNLNNAMLPITYPPSNTGIVVKTNIAGTSQLFTPNITQVNVQPILDTTIHGVNLSISWPAQPGIVSYNVYASPSPITRNFYKSTTSTTMSFDPDITIPGDVVWHFWVSGLNESGIETFIQDEPSFMEENDAFSRTALSQESEDLYIMDHGEMKFYIEEIRRRHKAMMENDGEPFYLFLRRWLGVPCFECMKDSTGVDNYGQGVGIPIDFKTGEPFETAVQAANPDFQTQYECPYCFGTGIMGGYYPKIQILARYGDVPARTIRYTKQGIDVSQDFNSWTLWFPRLHEHDFILRIRTGERFRIQDVGHAAWRGITTVQKFNAAHVNQTDPLYKVTDTAIQAGVALSSTFGHARFSWSVFK